MSRNMLTVLVVLAFAVTPCVLVRSADDALTGSNRVTAAGRSYIIWQKDIWGDISPKETVPAATERLKVLAVSTGQNTRTASGFVITNLSDKPLMGRLALEDPAEAGGVIGRERFEFRRAAYIERRNGVMIPEALVKLPSFNLVDVPARTTVLVWIEIDTHGLAAGRYKRKITFMPAYSGFPASSFDVNLDVAPIDLAKPKVPHFTYLTDPNRARFAFVAKDLVKHGITTVGFIPGRNRGYPKLDKAGNIVDMDHSTLDSIIDNMVTAGVSKDRLNVLIYLVFNRGYSGLPYDFKSQLSYGSDAWKTGFANSLRAIRDRLLEKGLGYSQFSFYIADEPHGDPDDSKTTAYLAIEGSRYVKQIDSKFRTMTNPSTKGENSQWLGRYIEEFDILEPFRGHLDGRPKVTKILRESGKEIWTYHILSNNVGPAVYRRLFWQAARDGFSGTCAFWAYDGYAGDMFNSHDHQPGNKDRITDYNVVYIDVKHEVPGLIPSRRWESSYQGNQDYRLIIICRELIDALDRAGGDVATFQATLTQTIARTAATASGDAMDRARAKLMALAVHMQTFLEEKKDGH